MAVFNNFLSQTLQNSPLSFFGNLGKYLFGKSTQQNQTNTKQNTNNTITPQDEGLSWDALTGSALGLALDPSADLLGIYGKKNPFIRFREKKMDETYEDMKRQGETINQTMNPKANLYSKLGAIADTQKAGINAGVSAARSQLANQGINGEISAPNISGTKEIVAATRAGTQYANMKQGAYGQYAQEQGQKAGLENNILAMRSDNADKASYVTNPTPLSNYLDAIMKGNLDWQQILGLKKTTDQKIEKKDSTNPNKHP